MNPLAKSALAVLGLFTGIQAQRCVAGEVKLERAQWPAETVCQGCITLQFGVLSMRLPTGLIGRIFVSGSDALALHLLPVGAVDARDDAVFLSSTTAAYIGKYQAAAPILQSMRGEAFFDLIGSPPSNDKRLDRIRHIEHVEAAEHYVKTSKGALHAYWIQTVPPQSQYLHIVIDGSDVVYTVAGAITPQLYRALLAGMSVQAEP